MQLIYSSTLAHHGIKGQRWGVRRYQNADGSLTEAGKKKYGWMDKKAASKDIKKASKIENTVTRKIGSENFEKAVNYQNRIIEANKKLKGHGNKMGKTYNDHYVRNVISKEVMNKKLSELNKKNEELTTQRDLIIKEADEFLKQFGNYKIANKNGIIFFDGKYF